MPIVKKIKVVVTITCGEENCGPCEFLSCEGICNLYDVKLKFGHNKKQEPILYRCKKCLKSEIIKKKRTKNNTIGPPTNNGYNYTY